MNNERKNKRKREYLREWRRRNRELDSLLGNISPNEIQDNCQDERAVCIDDTIATTLRELILADLILAFLGVNRGSESSSGSDSSGMNSFLGANFNDSDNENEQPCMVNELAKLPVMNFLVFFVEMAMLTSQNVPEPFCKLPEMWQVRKSVVETMCTLVFLEAWQEHST